MKSKKQALEDMRKERKELVLKFMEGGEVYTSTDLSRRMKAAGHVWADPSTIGGSMRGLVDRRLVEIVSGLEKPHRYRKLGAKKALKAGYQLRGVSVSIPPWA